MRVFVAGGTGVIGRPLVPQLVARGHQVTATTTSADKLAHVLSFGQMRDGGSHLNYSVYHDRYQRTAEGWKFAARADEIKYLDTTPLAGSPPQRTESATAR
jgi:nucleoside-diphosphate-sugar epimerase